MPRNLSQFIILGFLGAFSGAILAGFALFFIPKQYESSMEIRRGEVPPELLKSQSGVMYMATEMPDGYFYRSRSLFIIVSKRLELPERWGLSEYEVLKEMKECVRVEPKGDRTYLIAVRRNNSEEAYQIANSLLEANRERLAKMREDFKVSKKEATNFPDPLEVLKSPTQPKNFVFPRVDLVLATGATSGLVIGLALTFFLQRRAIR